MKKKVIIFDLADTLTELDPSPQVLIRNYFERKYCLELNEIDIRKSIVLLSNIFHYSSVKIKNKSSKKEFYLQFNSHLLNTLGVAHICSPDEIFNHFLENKSHWVLKKGVKKLLND